MKKISIFAFFTFLLINLHAQTQYGRVYTMLNTKCQNQNCHSATATDASAGLKFDGDSDAVYHQIFNKPSQLSASSVAKFEELVFPQQPYQSFLLRKIAGAKFDTDLALDSTGEGAQMYPVQKEAYIKGTFAIHDSLSNIEIEFVRQWIRFGALESYAPGPGGTPTPQPDYATIAAYYDSGQLIPFFTKPPAPPAGRGMRLRMGPVFLPTTGEYVEQEWLEQQIVNFPYEPEITRIDGFMNAESHHFLLFQYPDSAAARDPSGSNAAPDLTDLGQVTPSLLAQGSILGTNSFEGNKNLTAAWQETANVILPTGTGLMWDQKTYLDMNYHMKNYNATSVLPCDFYFNVYYEPRDANTIPMISNLVNNSLKLGVENFSCVQIPPLSIPDSQTYQLNYADNDNGNYGMRYIWMTAGHTHQWGTAYYVLVQDTSGALVDTVYSGQYDYTNQVEIGYWDHTHPPLEYWNHGLLPVYYGKSSDGSVSGGLVANTSYFATVPCLHFGYTTANEMQLFYYMYTNVQPPTNTVGVNTVDENPFSLTVIPNPVNDGNGKLVYVLDGTSKVSSVIVDVTGKVITQLNEETEVAGGHQISINSTQRLAAGIYFARLIVNGSAYTKKFVVTN